MATTPAITLPDADTAFLRRELARLEGRMMPFGTWRGLPLECVPRGYLAWCLRSFDLRPELREAILGVLSRPDPWPFGRCLAYPRRSRWY